MRKLKLGVVDQSPVPNGASAEGAVRATIELARVCDALGYSRYWLAEHHSTNSFAGSSPAVLIAAVAAATQGIRVGSGGVMLSHYSPLQVAENFRMLEALHPGRIDLGVGRAPGGDPRATLALRYGRAGIDTALFERQVEDLLGWLTDGFADAHPWRRVRAMPRVRSAAAPWLLGSGGSSAAIAARVGAGYAFAQFISGEDGAALVRSYRERFAALRPDAAPLAAVAVGVICAPTADEAHHLAGSLELWRARIGTGRDRGIPSPEEAQRELGGGWSAPGAGEPGARVVVGTPATVVAALHDLADRYGVDEVLVVTVTHDPAARVRSYRLLADAAGLDPRITAS